MAGSAPAPDQTGVDPIAWIPMLVAGVVPSHGGITATQLKAGIEDVLSRSKRPLEYFALAELPLTDRGKLSRDLLADWIARHGGHPNFWQPPLRYRPD